MGSVSGAPLKTDNENKDDLVVKKAEAGERSSKKLRVLHSLRVLRVMIPDLASSWLKDSRTMTTRTRTIF